MRCCLVVSRGDYRTGKRLNMRRIIPYIASNFQNDRIWLRRAKPSKREYQILIAVDDSSSMAENDCNQVPVHDTLEKWPYMFSTVVCFHFLFFCCADRGLLRRVLLLCCIWYICYSMKFGI